MILPTVRYRPSPNHKPRSKTAQIDMLVLHYTGMKTAVEAIERLCDPAARVSAHYVIEEHGTVWQLVPEALQAFHAGRSCWAGKSNLNDVSIGIEIVNPGHEWGYRPFPEEQMDAVERLSTTLVSRFQIPLHRVVGHSDIAPDRKSDPGELFDWPRLARGGAGIWPVPSIDLPNLRGRAIGAVERATALADLAAIGYCLGAGETAVVRAFQRRFRPERRDGRLDAETAARSAKLRMAYADTRRLYDGIPTQVVN
jgi:N-acetylmuramoyl-L-alanine amidase